MDKVYLEDLLTNQLGSQTADVPAWIVITSWNSIAPYVNCTLSFSKEMFLSIVFADIISLNQDFANNDVAAQAKEGIEFLTTRQDFWRQQKPKNAGPIKIKRREVNKKKTWWYNKLIVRAQSLDLID